jgi:hypothetical protein
MSQWERSLRFQADLSAHEAVLGERVRDVYVGVILLLFQTIVAGSDFGLANV